MFQCFILLPKLHDILAYLVPAETIKCVCIFEDLIMGTSDFKEYKLFCAL